MIETKSIELKLLSPDLPPAQIARVGDARAQILCLANTVSPKSVAFPVVAIVIKSTVFNPAVPPSGIPAAEIPLTALEQVAVFLLSVKSPKSTAFPVYMIVTYSILFCLVPALFPPDAMARV